MIIGAPPYDIHIPIFRRYAKRHSAILHTSWPYWEGDFVPKSAYISKQRELWEDFLENLPTVGVTQAATEAVADLGADAYHIPHPVDTDIYTPNAGEDTDSVNTVLFVGRFVEEKGIKQLLSTARNWNGPETEFVFVGDGPLSDQISAATDEDNIVYHGYVSNEERLASIYASSDVFALPSYPTDYWEELFGIVIIEAFASGTPVVATDCVGPREIVDDGETGYLVEQQNEAAFADALHRLLEDDERRAAFGERARAVAENTYDIEIIADQWLEVLQDVSPELHVRD